MNISLEHQSQEAVDTVCAALNHCPVPRHYIPKLGGIDLTLQSNSDASTNKDVAAYLRFCDGILIYLDGEKLDLTEFCAIVGIETTPHSGLQGITLIGMTMSLTRCSSHSFHGSVKARLNWLFNGADHTVDIEAGDSMLMPRGRVKQIVAEFFSIPNPQKPE